MILGNKQRNFVNWIYDKYRHELYHPYDATLKRVYLFGTYTKEQQYRLNVIRADYEIEYKEFLNNKKE